MARAPGSLESLRRVNRSRVVAVLQRSARASRADIVRATGLSRTTVSSVVADLLADGTVVQRPEPAPSQVGRGGRPAILLELDPSSGGFVGLDFAHDGVRGVLSDRAGAPLAEAREDLDVDHHAEQALGAAAQIVAAMLGEAGLARGRVLGVGAAVSAPLRSHRQVTASERIFPGWAELDVGSALATRLGLPVSVGNDANLGALAEATFGAGRGVGNLLYVMLSAGVGAGIILGGRLYEGDTGTAGELGHVVVDPAGQVCRCGNRGCLETVAGAVALTAALRHSYAPSATLGELLALLETGDVGAQRLVADAGRAVGRALAGVCSVLDPGLVIIGGELAAAGPVLLEAIGETVERRTSPATGHDYPLIAGALGARAEALGAIALAMSDASDHALAPAAGHG